MFYGCLFKYTNVHCVPKMSQLGNTLEYSVYQCTIHIYRGALNPKAFPTTTKLKLAPSVTFWRYQETLFGC